MDKVNALLMDANDNVVTCVQDVHKGEEIVYKQGDQYVRVVARENIPYCHKAAIAPIEKVDM